MSAAAQNELVNNAGEAIGRPELVEQVTKAILTVTGLNAQAFSGAMNPSTIYRQMVDGSPSVFPYYRETEEKDLCIGSALETRRILALAREARVQPADPENGQAMQYAEEANAFLESIPKFSWVLWELLDCVGYGYTVQEILWRIGSPSTSLGVGAGISVEKIIGRPQELFRFGKLYEPQIGPLHLANFPGGEGVPVPLNKFLVATYQPRQGDQRGRPLLRRLFWSSWFVRNVLRLHLKFLEKGSGTTVVQYSSAAGDAEKTKALEAASAIANEIAVAVPEGFKILPETLDKGRTRDANDFTSLATSFREEMTRMILGQTGSTRSGEGGYSSEASSKVHLELLWEYVRHDLGNAEDVINEQLLTPWLAWTFGPQALDRAMRPYWRADKQPPKDRGAELDLLAKARNMGAEVPKQSVYELGGIRAPDEGEETLPPPALSAAMLGDLSGVPRAE